MMNHQQHWIATADGRRAALFACQRLPGGGLHLEPGKVIENSHEAEHERHRPTLAGGAERRGSVASSGARAAPHAVSAGHTAEEEQRRFAREVSGWLNEARQDPGRQRLTVFAPPRFLGLLRAELGDRENPPELREGELSHLRPQELAVHPAVVAAVASPVGGER